MIENIQSNSKCNEVQITSKSIIFFLKNNSKAFLVNANTIIETHLKSLEWGLCLEIIVGFI